MHSFEFTIRICQPENSDVHRGEAEVKITFDGGLILMLTEKNAPENEIVSTITSQFF